jgi:hypothetical protein
MSVHRLRLSRRWRSELVFPSLALRACVLLALPLLAGGFSFPAQQRGRVEATLEVRIADRPPAPGLAAATYVLRLKGPAGLEADPPRLADATGAWQPLLQTSAWSADDAAAVVEEVVELRQVKPGPAPLPGVKVRFREGPSAPWQEAEWPDVLRPERDGLAPEAPPPVPSAPGWLPAVVAAGLGAVVLLAGGWGLLWRRRAPPAPLPPGPRTLRELEQLEQAALPGCDGSALHVRLADAVRRYLAERFGLRALEQTTAEFLESARPVPQLDGARQELLRDFLQRCDLAKFARAGLSPEDCRRTAALARALVEQTEALR